jgi:ribosomal protein L7/L12
MDSLTLVAIALAVLAVVVTVIVLRRSWGSSLSNIPEPSLITPTKVLPRPLANPDLAEIVTLLTRGNKIEAIKRVRELTGLGLKEAKDYVEAMPSNRPLPTLPSRSTTPQAGAGDLAEVHALAQQGHKIEAIKRYRQLTGVGLKEAKDYVDRL